MNRAELFSGHKHHSEYLKQKRSWRHGIRNTNPRLQLPEHTSTSACQGSGPFRTIRKADHWRVIPGTAGAKNTRPRLRPGTRKALGCYRGHLSSLGKLGTGQRAGLYQEKTIRITKGRILGVKQRLLVKVFAVVNRWCNFEGNDLRTLPAL